MTTERYVIWNLNDIDLSKITEELGKDQYRSPIIYTEKEKGNFDDYFENSWINKDGEQEFEINEVTLSDDAATKIKYVYAKALFESGYGEKRAYANEELLPRAARVFNHEVDACFFEFEASVYVVLKINSSLEGRIRSTMFSFSNNEGNKVKTKYSKVPNYWMSSDFYYWILYKSAQREDTVPRDITFYNISSLNQTDNIKSYDSQNEGNNVLDFTNVLSGLGEKQDISKIKIGINLDASHIMLEMNSDCVFEVNMDTFRVSHRIAETSFVNNALFLYHYLVPKLFTEYKEETDNGSWNESVSETSRKDWAFSAIANLSLANDIEIDEIEEYLQSNGYN